MLPGVQHFKFKHISLISISLSGFLLSTQWASALAFPTGLGAGAGAAGASPPPTAPAASALASRQEGLLRRRQQRRPLHPRLVAGVVLLVLESVLDNPSLVATSGALNLLDVLVIRGQDCL